MNLIFNSLYRRQIKTATRETIDTIQIGLYVIPHYPNQSEIPNDTHYSPFCD